MKFTVQFSDNKSTDSYYAVLNAKGKEVGIRLINEIRKELNKEDLSLDAIEGKIEQIICNPIIELSEEQAITSGRFAEQCSINVNCGRKQLNDYVKEKIIPTIKEETNEITSVKVIYEVDKERVLNAWGRANYPIEFKPF